MRYIRSGLPWADEQIQAFVSQQIETHSARGFCRWKLLSKAEGAMIGFCGLGFVHHVSDAQANTPEIGWWLARTYWGQGLATEAAGAVLRDGFERVKLDRIVSIARPANTASIRIMQKLGLTFDSEFNLDGIGVQRYAMDRCQYLASRSKEPIGTAAGLD